MNSSGNIDERFVARLRHQFSPDLNGWRLTGISNEAKYGVNGRDPAVRRLEAKLRQNHPEGPIEPTRRMLNSFPVGANLDVL